MYYFYLGGMEIPIPPEDIKTRIKNRNKTISLINGGDVNIPRDAGLTEIDFDMLLPNNEYPFVRGLSKFRGVKYYLTKLKKIKTEKRPVQFVVCRLKANGTMLTLTNIRVLLEDYVINESVELGYDFMVSISLKQYKTYGTKKITVTEGENGKKVGQIQGTRNTDKIPPKEILIKKGGSESLWQQLKKVTGSGDDWLDIKKLNKIAIPTFLTVGSVIRRD